MMPAFTPVIGISFSVAIDWDRLQYFDFADVVLDMGAVICHCAIDVGTAVRCSPLQI
jgi:hypothetical protein